jgi:meiotic recombination protein SPO11
MDLDILSEILADRHPALHSDLLSNLPNRPLIHNRPDANHDGPDADAEAIDSPAESLNPLSLNQAGAVISKIEDIFESIADSIINQKEELVIQLKTRRKPGNQVYDNASGVLKSLHDDEMRAIRFPSKTPQEAWKFSKFVSF